jgi:hypothetical protein
MSRRWTQMVVFSTSGRFLGNVRCSATGEIPRSQGSESLQSRDAFILKYPDHNATILGFAVCRFILDYLATLAHRSWSQHVRKRYMAPAVAGCW